MALFNKVNKGELKARLQESDVIRTTLSFYRYVTIEEPASFRAMLFKRLEEMAVYGRIYVAKEGINGQISVPQSNLNELHDYLDGLPLLTGMRLNIAIDDDGKSFYVLKIKLREKIVADGLPEGAVDPAKGGTHIDAETFNQMTDREDTVVVDMRNHYESEVGHFEGALCPDVETFRESLPLVHDLLEEHRSKNIVMYCTGGIRCEKATAYFRKQGFENLYQLDGGIIEYARQVKARRLANKFKGKNFVFDERLGERITGEVIAQCHQCGTACDDHTNCANDACHLLFIQCPTCAEKFDQCCSSKCKDFISLSAEDQAKTKKDLQFNGSKFGKGRYKAHHDEMGLDLG
ncbi:MAG: rhodanese-related sulfurtransferase [Saprospiraceae bacterium]|nr:rhodanese-related sulfurtransferase [Saprospiraceae bacterium]